MTKKSLRRTVALLLAAGASVVMAAPPAPQATASAGGIKQLRFNWNAVSGATGYELWFLANAGSQPVRFFQMPGSQRSVINNVSVHLLDWSNARYWVNACDSSGCTSSSRLAVSNLMLDTIGVFNPPSLQPASEFGTEVAVSSDGTVLAALAPKETTADPDFPEASVYVYRKSGGAWTYEASIPLDVSYRGSTNNADLAISGDGEVLAIGLPIDQPRDSDTGYGRGSVRVFRFDQRNGWKHEATIAQRTGFELYSSDQVELDQSGRTLAVKTELGASGVFIYTDDGSGSWSHTGTVIGHGNAPENGETCGRFALSADGKVIARSCSEFYPQVDTQWFEVYAAPGWGIRDTITAPPGTYLTALSADSTGDALAVASGTSGDTSTPNVEIYRRLNGAYQREAVLRRGAWNNNVAQAYPTQFGFRGEFSADGKLLAVSYPGDVGIGTGALTPPLAAGTKATGAVYVYERRTNGWNLRRVVKPGRAGSSYETGTFGRSIDFGDNGKTLAVGQPAANNNAGVTWLY
jgi:trimeric autotransporter adhesin